MIYIHVPFCKQACHYCDFHFSTSMRYKDEMIQAIRQEIAQRKDYLEDKSIQSIYFGGGTPSVLDTNDVQQILDQIHQHFDVAPDAEITLEANPDDLDPQKVSALRQTAINRFSIGIQSFYEEDLRWMNRAHNAQEADAAIKRVQDAGFDNITCDLIYGYPLLTHEKWRSNMEKMVGYGIPHISSYAMTVEEKTALHHFIQKGKTKPLDDDQSATQMEYLIQTLRSHGFEHYEISNFAKDQKFAKHNTNYWFGKHYLGIGPSAHSFNGHSRSWNISNNAQYITGIGQNTPNLEVEILTTQDQINEYIMTSLRTMWGLHIPTVEKRFGTEAKNRILRESQTFLSSQDLQYSDDTLKLTAKGKRIADYIASELFVISDL